MTLQNLKTLSYNFPDQNVSLANEFTEKLNESFYSRFPNEAGLIIFSQAQESIHSTKRREHIKTRNMQIYHLGRNTRKVWSYKTDRLRMETNKSKVSLLPPLKNIYASYTTTYRKSKHQKGLRMVQQ